MLACIIAAHCLLLYESHMKQISSFPAIQLQAVPEMSSCKIVCPPQPNAGTADL